MPQPEHYALIDEAMRNIHTAVPRHLQSGLYNYLRFGGRPGSFLCAVIDNEDFNDAVCRCSDLDLASLRAVCLFLCNYCPSECWGSRAKREAWEQRARAHNPAELSGT
jgi:hypothetical protein